MFDASIVGAVCISAIVIEDFLPADMDVYYLWRRVLLMYTCQYCILCIGVVCVINVCRLSSCYHDIIFIFYVGLLLWGLQFRNFHYPMSFFNTEIIILQYNNANFSNSKEL